VWENLGMGERKILKYLAGCGPIQLDQDRCRLF
jgi:hypothetical protein